MKRGCVGYNGGCDGYLEGETHEAHCPRYVKARDFQKIATDIGALLQEKNTSYGNAFDASAAFLNILYPHGIAPAQYTDLGLLIRIFDKMMRIANGASTEDPYQDIAGYGILGVKKGETK